MGAYIAGFFLSFGLIMAIGAQNAFVLRQGLRGHHVLAVCLTCAISDMILIAAGVAGFGLVASQLPWLEPLMRYGGAIFLFAYALRNLWSAWHNKAGLEPTQQASVSLMATIGVCLTLTWANPHVYLDTVMLLGSISTQYEPHKLAFTFGAITASFLFFFALGYGARLLRPLFANPQSWRILDLLVAIIMFTIGLKLVF